MENAMENERSIRVQDVLDNQDETIKWIASQPEHVQPRHAAKGFDLLLGEAGRPKAVSGQTCIRLCSFVDHCIKSEAPKLREWAFSRDVTGRLFNFYVEWNESDQHRSMRLVLDLLVQLHKRNPDRDAAAEIQRDLLKTLLEIIIGISRKPVAKSSIKIVDLFLAKGIFTLNDVKVTYSACRPSDSSDDTDVWRRLFAELLQWLQNRFVQSVAGRIIVLLYRGLRSQETPVPVETLRLWLLNFLAEEPDQLESVKNYILVPFFKAGRREALLFLREINEHEMDMTSHRSEMDMPTLLQLAALESGKRIGYVEEPALSSDRKTIDVLSPLVLPERILSGVLSHPSHEVRTFAFSLLITSSSTTRPYSEEALNLLRSHLGEYFADNDAKFRVDVMAKARDMFKRVRGSICVLKRSIPRAKAKVRKQQDQASEGGTAVYQSNLISLPVAELERYLDYHLDFLCWYVAFLCGELVPTASYQRHSGSLKALSWVLRMEGDESKSWKTPDDQEIFYDLFDSTWARALYDLILDGFDDVRESASTCLRSILSDGKYRKFTLESSGGSSVKELQGLLDRANELSRRTARADHADGAARAGQLLYGFLREGHGRSTFLSGLLDELERKLCIAEADLGRAVLEAPVHGDFATLRYIWQVVSETTFEEKELEVMGKLQGRLVHYCERVWAAVRYILCDDSPEGHLPQELEEVDGLNTKDVLSYSFRSIHESSNLMRTMVLNLRNRSKQGLVGPSEDAFARVGNLSFEQLSSLRHRGAFTTVSMTFATCCQQTKHLENSETTKDESLLSGWYKGTMDAIYAQASTTRRSAGIPSLMTGILSANATDPSFDMVMEKLIEISGTQAFVRETDGSNLPQVHAFNCLKDIFKSHALTSMGNKAESYLSQCLVLAANSLRSELWAIRNCALILLRSLIDRLFGYTESKSAIESGWDGKANRIHYHRYPTLPTVLVNLLRSGEQMLTRSASDTAGAESVFPSLDIVRRAGPPDLLRGELEGLISRYLASPVWHVREMAARTLCSCLLHKGWLSEIKSLFQEAIDNPTRNTLNFIHGIFLTLKFVFERLGEVELNQVIADLPELITFLQESKIDQQFGHCHEVLSAYLEVVNQVSSFSALHSVPTKQIEVVIPAVCGSALLKIQVAVYHVHSAYRGSSAIDGLRQALLGNNNGSDTLASALELMPKLWNVSCTPDDVLSELASFYVDLCLETDKSEPQVMALEGLAEILTHLLQKENYTALKSLRLIELWSALPFRHINPALSNAILRVSGSIMAIFLHFDQLASTSLQAWSLIVTDAGLDDKSFDTRLASAKALESFFAVRINNCTSEAYLPLLLAAYDILNDDDDEIRDVGSVIVRHILGAALVPLEAANRLLQWLSAKFTHSSTFKSIVASRLTGTKSSAHAWTPATDQLASALKADDSLFVVEEQNLFIDEIREAQRWVSVYEALSWEQSEAPIRDLDTWLCGGLPTLQALLEQDDGPLGWASDPHVFAICYVLIRCSVALKTKGHASTQLSDGLLHIKQAVQSNQNRHISGLLTEPLSNHS